MELVSETLTNQMKVTPYSTMVNQNQKWFSDNYLIDNTSKNLPEKKDNIFLIPGKIYTFGYNPITPEEELLARCPAFSFRPINFIIGQRLTKAGNFVPYGIQLTFIPPRVRIQILDQIIRVFGSEIINPSLVQIKAGNQPTRTLPVNWEMMQKMLEDSGFEYCIRSYRYEAFTTMPQIISYEDWHKLCTFTIPFIKTANLLGIRSVYQSYIKNLRDNNDKIRKIQDVKIAAKTIKEIKSYRQLF